MCEILYTAPVSLRDCTPRWKRQSTSIFAQARRFITTYQQPLPSRGAFHVHLTPAERRVRRYNVTDPAEQTGGEDPDAPGHNEPEDRSQKITVVDLPESWYQKTENRCNAGLLHPGQLPLVKGKEILSVPLVVAIHGVFHLLG